MNVVGHQTISRAKQSFARSRVQHHFAENSMKRFAKPALLPMHGRHGPEYDGITLIKLSPEPWQIVRKSRTVVDAG